jgi:hypothetical protein
MSIMCCRKELTQSGEHRRTSVGWWLANLDDVKWSGSHLITQLELRSGRPGIEWTNRNRNLIKLLSNKSGNGTALPWTSRCNAAQYCPDVWVDYLVARKAG